MAAPNVNVREIDISTRVPTFPGLYVGLVIPDAKKGAVNTPVLSTSDTQFLALRTPNGKVAVGYDNAYFSGLAVHQKSNKLWSVRPKTTGQLYGGAVFFASGSASAGASLSVGEDDPEAHTFGAESILITGADAGSYNNDLAVKIYNYKANENVTFTQNDSTTSVAQKWGLGYPVKFTTTGVLPAPLVPNVTYFAVPSSTGKIKLAVSQSDAFNASPVTVELTTAGSGIATIRPATQYTKTPDTFVIQVYKKSNLNQPLESKVCSKIPGTKDGFGRNMYVEEIFKSSVYINVVDNLLVSDLGMNDQIKPVSLAGGSDGAPATDGQCIQALSVFSNGDIPVTLIIDGGRATVNYHQAIISIAENRNDTVGILSTPFEAEDSRDYLNAVVDYRNFELNANTSHASMYSSHVEIYDKFNDRDIWVSPDGFMAALISETAANYEIWYPVAGFRRGIMNVKDVRRRWTRGEMDYLYDNGINPIRFAPGRGIVVWGQKTLQANPSALDRLNVRLLLTVIEPSIAIALENFVFEINDGATRAIVKATVDSAMTRIKARRGVYEFTTICDASINTDSDIDNHQLNVQLFIQPAQSIEQVEFTLVVTPTGISLKLAQAAI